MAAVVILPSSLSSYTVPARVLDDTRELLAEPGSHGLEAVVVWFGAPVSAKHAVVLGAIRPRQIAYRSPRGLSVEVPPDALMELITALPEGTAIVVRVHTHPGDAYHSDLDDTNMLISHQGAVSIVVPRFAAEPISLERCSINVLDHRSGWHELDPQQVRDRFVIQ